MVKNKNMIYLTILSILSSYAVVLLHTNSCFWNYSVNRYWMSANVIEGVMYFAVPIFFMITGVTLLDYRDKYSTSKFFLKRLNKTFIPFIFWSFICIIYKAFLDGQLSIHTFNLHNIVNSILNISVNVYYWYFPALFGVYFSIPVLSVIPKDKKIEIFKYIVVMTILFNYIMPLIFQFGLHMRYGDNYMFHIGSRYIAYICTGYLLHHCKINKKQTILVYLLGILSLIVTIVMTYVLSSDAHKVIKTFINYESLTQYFYAVMIFVFIKYIGDKINNAKIINFIKTVGQYTFSIYLIHWFIIYYFVNIIEVDKISIVYRVGGSFVVYIGSIAIVYILRKIPILRRFLP